MQIKLIKTTIINIAHCLLRDHWFKSIKQEGVGKFPGFSPYQKEFEDTKGVIRIRISKTNRQHNDQKIKYKKTNNDLQNIHIKIKIK